MNKHHATPAPAKVSFPKTLISGIPETQKNRWMISDETDFRADLEFGTKSPLAELIKSPLPLPEALRSRWIRNRGFSENDQQQVLELAFEVTTARHPDFFDIVEEVRVADDVDNGFTIVFGINADATSVSLYVLEDVAEKLEEALALECAAV